MCVAHFKWTFSFSFLFKWIKCKQTTAKRKNVVMQIIICPRYAISCVFFFCLFLFSSTKWIPRILIPMGFLFYLVSFTAKQNWLIFGHFQFALIASNEKGLRWFCFTLSFIQWIIKMFHLSNIIIHYKIINLLRRLHN